MNSSVAACKCGHSLPRCLVDYFANGLGNVDSIDDTGNVDGAGTVDSPENVDGIGNVDDTGNVDGSGKVVDGS